MKIRDLHSWQVSTREARAIQQELKAQIRQEDEIPLDRIKTVAAADVSFNRFGKTLFGGVVFMEFPGLRLLDVCTRISEATFPYIPGYLSFREAPVILDILRDFEIVPDVLLCDGQGVAHPRGLGLASHLGLFLDIPTIGCAKSVLVGKYEEPSAARGSVSYLWYEGKKVGAALRTRAGVKPVFVSCGHKISLDSAVEVVLKCSPRYRIPEPLRRAHLEVNNLRRKYKEWHSPSRVSTVQK